MSGCESSPARFDPVSRADQPVLVARRQGGARFDEIAAQVVLGLDEWLMAPPSARNDGCRTLTSSAAVLAHPRA